MAKKLVQLFCTPVLANGARFALSPALVRPLYLLPNIVALAILPLITVREPYFYVKTDSTFCSAINFTILCSTSHQKSCSNVMFC